jgi:hypothetical protein
MWKKTDRPGMMLRGIVPHDSSSIIPHFLHSIPFPSFPTDVHTQFHSIAQLVPR